MEFTANKSDIVKALSSAMDAVEKRTTIPILGFAKIDADKDGLTITTSDLELAIRVAAKANVKKSGSGMIPAKRLNSYLQALAEGEVHFKYSEQHWLSINSGSSKTRIAGMDTAGFPEVPQSPGGARVAAIALRQLATSVAFVIPDMDDRNALSGARLRRVDDRLEMVSTDKARLAHATAVCAIEGDLPEQMLLPKRFVQAICKLTKTPDDEAIELAYSDNLWFASVNGTSIASRKMTGGFPEIDKLLATLKHTATFSVDIPSLANAIKRVGQFSEERDIHNTIDIKVADGVLTLKAMSQDSGESEESLPALGEGSFFARLNSKFLTDFCRAASSETMQIHTSKPESPVELTDGTGFRYLMQGLR